MTYCSLRRNRYVFLLFVTKEGYSQDQQHPVFCSTREDEVWRLLCQKADRGPRKEAGIRLCFATMSSLYDVSCFAAGLAGNVFALALFLSPVPTFKRVLKAKSTEQFDGLPYLLSLLNCCICLWYGLPWVSDGGRALVATVNCTGALFQLAYISLFIFYADSRTTRLKVAGLLVLVVFAFALIAHASIAFFDQPLRQLFVGSVSMASLVSMFASPLAVMGVVVRTECVEFMPFYLSLSTFLMSASFAVYGLLLRDFFIYFPNGLGVILGAMQLVLYAYYSRRWKSSDSSAPLLA